MVVVKGAAVAYEVVIGAAMVVMGVE